MGIPLSEKHGVNPSLGVCWFCQEESGEIILPGKLPGDAEAPRKGIWYKHPCPKCEELMKVGVICISVRKGSEEANPYRTGGWCVVKEEAVKRWPLDDVIAVTALAKRAMWIEDEIWDLIGLPRGESFDNREE